MVDTDAVELDLPRGVALAWGIAADPQRGPKREMSVERIVEAAVEIADAEGLGAVSMAAVAARLGYTPMSLYRYVTAKDDLILLMQEEATGPAARGDSRGRRLARAARGAVPRAGPALPRAPVGARHPDQRLADHSEQRRVDGCRSRGARRDAR